MGRVRFTRHTHSHTHSHTNVKRSYRFSYSNSNLLCIVYIWILCVPVGCFAYPYEAQAMAIKRSAYECYLYYLNLDAFCHWPPASRSRIRFAIPQVARIVHAVSPLTALVAQRLWLAKMNHTHQNFVDKMEWWRCTHGDSTTDAIRKHTSWMLVRLLGYGGLLAHTLRSADDVVASMSLLNWLRLPLAASASHRNCTPCEAAQLRHTIQRK